MLKVTDSKKTAEPEAAPPAPTEVIYATPALCWSFSRWSTTTGYLRFESPSKDLSDFEAELEAIANLRGPIAQLHRIDDTVRLRPGVAPVAGFAGMQTTTTTPGNPFEQRAFAQIQNPQGPEPGAGQGDAPPVDLSGTL